jgi:hypothetical protein
MVLHDLAGFLMVDLGEIVIFCLVVWNMIFTVCGFCWVKWIEILLGGLEHFLCSISYIWDNPSH